MKKPLRVAPNSPHSRTRSGTGYERCRRHRRTSPTATTCRRYTECSELNTSNGRRMRCSCRRDQRCRITASPPRGRLKSCPSHSTWSSRPDSHDRPTSAHRWNSHRRRPHRRCTSERVRLPHGRPRPSPKSTAHSRPSAPASRMSIVGDRHPRRRPDHSYHQAHRCPLRRAHICRAARPDVVRGVHRRCVRRCRAAGNPIRVNCGHDKTRTVGRVISFDAGNPRGLIAEIRIAKTQFGDETLTLAAEDCLSASVAFSIPAGGAQHDHQRRHRRVNRAELDHVSLVDHPLTPAPGSCGSDDAGHGRTDAEDAAQ